MSSGTSRLSYFQGIMDWANQPSLKSQVQQTLNTLDQTAKQVKSVVGNPEEFSCKFVKGILRGFQGGEEEDKESGSLVDKIKEIAINGATSGSVVILENFLENSQTLDTDPEDAQLKETALQTLSRAKTNSKNLEQSAKQVWATINKYHILFGNFQINRRASSNEMLAQHRKEKEGTEKNNGVSPAHGLVLCQQAYRKIRETFNIALPPYEEKQAVEKLPSRQHFPPNLKNQEELERETNKKIQCFCEKIIHYCTMYTVDKLFHNKVDAVEYNKILQQPDVDFKKEYLARFAPKGKIKRFFFRKAYEWIYLLIHPLIEKTISQAVQKSLREFLKNDKEFLAFLEDKIKEISVYYGEIENGRINYLKERSEGDFARYLESKVKHYGEQKFSEKELIRLFEEYIVQHYVPKPQFKIKGFRIPLLFPFFEWIVYSLRKRLVLYFLKHSEIVDRILKEGTHSVHYAQLGLKNLLLQKLTHIINMFDKSRQTLPETEGKEEEQNQEAAGPKSSEESELEHKKKEFITRQLHLAILAHSEKLLRFIEIESCNNNNEKLENLNNSLSAIISLFLKATHDLFEWKILSPKEALESAATDILETALVSLFDNRDQQIEEELQEILHILDRSFVYMSPKEKSDYEKIYRQECAQVDKHLSLLMEQISKLALETTLENNLKKVPGEKHFRIKKFIDEQKKSAFSYLKEVFSLPFFVEGNFEEIEQLNKYSVFKEAFVSLFNLTDNWLSFISTSLQSSQFQECYTDVQGDMHNLYSLHVSFLEFWRPLVEAIGLEINELGKNETQIACFVKAHAQVLDLLIKENADKEETIQKLEMVSRLVEGKEISLLSQESPMRMLSDAFKKKYEIKEKIEGLAQIEQTLIAIKKKKEQILEIEEYASKLKRLSSHLYAFQNFKKDKHQERSQEERFKEIESLYLELAGTKNPLLLPIKRQLASANTLALYEVFYPKISFGRKPRIHSSVEILLSNLSKEAASLASDLENQKKKAQIADVNLEFLEGIKKDLALEEKKIDPLISELASRSTSYIETKTIILLGNIKKCHASIQTNYKQICETAYYLFYLTEQMSVKGCISFGEIKFFRTLAPQIMEKISEVLITGIQTLVDSFGKPFHYKQLALRLLFLHIAKMQQKKE